MSESWSEDESEDGRQHSDQAIKYHLNQRLSDLLVYGYVRRIATLKSRLNIPADVHCLIIKFYLQVLPQYRLHNAHWHIDENQILSVPRDHHAGFVLFTVPWNSGVHEMELECLYDHTGSVSIGILSNAIALFALL